MGGITTLLAEARAEGLAVSVADTRLLINGPASAEALARELLARKPEVIEALKAESTSEPEPEQSAAITNDWPNDWPPDAIDPDHVGHCERCGSYLRWLPLTGGPWRCQRCEPARWPRGML